MRRSSDQQLPQYFSAFDPPVAALALALRELLLAEAPDAIEKVYRNHPSAIWFGLGPKMKDMLFYIAAARSHVNLGFCYGASLPDPNHVFEGEGKVMRHIKFRSASDLKRAFLRRYIRAALKQIKQTTVAKISSRKKRAP